MNHLSTTTCECGHEFTARDIRPPLMGQKQVLGRTEHGFYGGNVDRFCESSCPVCGKGYHLWLKQTGQTWRVVTISRRGWEPEAEEDGGVTDGDFETMGKPALREWLDANQIEYVPQWSEQRLRELAINAYKGYQNEEQV